MPKPVDFEFTEAILSRRAADLGLASLLTGSVLAIASLLVLQINLQLYKGGMPFSMDELKLLRIVTIVGFVLMIAFCTASIVFGISSLLAARKYRQNSALGWAGVFMSLWAILLWIGTLLDLFFIIQAVIGPNG